jgi:hypothetical protein
MRILGTLCTLAALLVFLVAPVPGYSQERDENRPNQPQDEKNQKKNNDKGRPEDRNARPDERKQQDSPNAGRQDERQNRPEADRRQEQQQRERRPAANDSRSERTMERDQHGRPAAQQGRHIPDDQFRSHFGRQHTFHVHRQQIVNVPQPVIVYSGYSFELVDPWPAEWSYDDDCYVDYIDGEYFLFDVLHPGIRIALFVVG